MNMREKIARALADDIQDPLPRFTHQKWEDLTELAKDAMFRRADAALSAMREPDEAMCWAISEQVVGNKSATAIWQAAMIAAAQGDRT